MCLTGGFPEFRRLFHLSESAGQVRMWQNDQVTKAKSSWKLKRVCVETSCGCRRVRRALDCQECVRRTRERWTGSRVVRWTLRSHCEVRRTPRFQEGTDVSDIRKRCDGEGNSGWLWRRRVRVTIDQGRRTGQDGVVRLITWELWTGGRDA